MSNETNGGAAAQTPAKQAAAKKAAAKKTAQTRPASKKADVQNKAESNAPENKTSEPKKKPAQNLTNVSTAPAQTGGKNLKVGNFVMLRALQGDKPYKVNDPRSLRISEGVHLLRSGAMAPADKATLEACKALYPALELSIPKKS